MQYFCEKLAHGDASINHAFTVDVPILSQTYGLVVCRM